MTNCTRMDFLGALTGCGALADVITLTEARGSVRAETRDSHASHAVELIANRAGLRALATMTDDGLHVVTVRGFSR